MFLYLFSVNSSISLLQVDHLLFLLVTDVLVLLLSKGLLFLVDFFHYLQTVLLCQGCRHHALFQLLKRGLFFVLEHLQTLDQRLLSRFKVLSLLLVLVNKCLLLLSASLLVGLADADLVHAVLLDLLPALGGHLSDAFTLSLFIHAVLLLKHALPVHVFIQLLSH